MQCLSTFHLQSNWMWGGFSVVVEAARQRGVGQRKDELKVEIEALFIGLINTHRWIIINRLKGKERENTAKIVVGRGH